MTGNGSEAAHAAKGIIRGIADGDIRVLERTGGWVRLPASQPQGEGIRLPSDIVKRLLARDLLRREGLELVPSARGLRYAAQIQTDADRVVRAAKPVPQQHSPRRRQAAESPLEWLHTRRGANGQPLISQAAFDAGERLRSDYTRAGLMPRLGADLTGTVPGRGRKAGARGPGEIMDAALMARDRVNAALKAVGSDLAGVAVDICCHLRSLGEVERERGWPKRSGKVVLDLALSRLADHYGIGDVATGTPRRGRVGHWGADGYRPNID